MRNFFYFTFFYLVGILLINIFYTEDYGNFLFLLASFIGLVYNALVLFKTNVLFGSFKLLSAGFIGVFVTFIVFNGGAISLLYVENFNFIEANNFRIFMNNRALVKFASVAAVGNIFYWLGYMSKAGDYFFSLYYIGLKFKKLLKLEIKPLFPKILIVIGVILNTILFVNGSFGRNEVDTEQVGGFMKILITYSFFAEKLAQIGFFLLAGIYFKNKTNKRWFFGTLIVLIIFSLLYGARGPIIILFILTILPYYYVHKKINLKIVLGGFLTILIAFTLASELKVFTNTLHDSEVSIDEYSEAFEEFQVSNDANLERKIYGSLYFNILQRLSTVAQGSIAMDYIDTHKLEKSDPPFISELVKIPLHTFVPRSKFLGTSFPAWGNWFRLKILGYSDSYHSNTSFGIVGFFYMAGKWIGVILGFYIYGIVFRFSNNILEIKTGISFLVYLAILSAIVNVGASIPSSYASFLRFIIFLPLLFYSVIRVVNSIRL